MYQAAAASFDFSVVVVHLLETVFLTPQHYVNYTFFFHLQGSTLRKRKMYEEFLSKVSILGKFWKIAWRIVKLKLLVMLKETDCIS